MTASERITIKRRELRQLLKGKLLTSETQVEGFNEANGGGLKGPERRTAPGMIKCDVN